MLMRDKIREEVFVVGSCNKFTSYLVTGVKKNIYRASNGVVEVPKLYKNIKFIDCGGTKFNIYRLLRII